MNKNIYVQNFVCTIHDNHLNILLTEVSHLKYTLVFFK